MKHKTECTKTIHVWSSLYHCKCGLTTWSNKKHKYTKDNKYMKNKWEQVRQAGLTNLVELKKKKCPIYHSYGVGQKPCPKCGEILARY